MTPSEAAGFLKVSEEDVIAAINAGELKARKIGSAYRISKKPYRTSSRDKRDESIQPVVLTPGCLFKWSKIKYHHLMELYETSRISG